MKRLAQYWEHIVLTIALLAIAGPLLVPGYILALDMIWVPDLVPMWQTDGFTNAYPLHVLFAALATVVPSWVVQKLLVVAMLALLLWVPWRFLPVTGAWPRVIAALVYAVNPFVYTRLLAGQWFVLLGYALLPLLLYVLWQWVKQPSYGASVRLAGVWALVALVSVHYAYVAGLVIAAAMLSVVVKQKGSQQVLIQAGLVTVVAAILSAYWTVPAIQRSAPLEERFDAAHLEAFAASSHGDVLSVYANVAVLGGFWAEDGLWLHSFWWPQTQAIFWVGFAGLVLLLLCGAWYLYETKQRALVGVLAAGVAIYMLSFGAGETVFQFINMTMYDLMPGWNGLRDSTKLVGLLAFLYATLAGLGVQQLIRRRIITSAYVPVLLLVPVLVGLLMWGGLRGQLAPTWYPDSWTQVQAELRATDARALTLPWRGYYSLDFADGRTVANVASRYFGHQYVITGRSVELGNITNQEVDTRYQQIESFLISEAGHSPEITQDWLQQQGITHLLVMSDQTEFALGNWWLPQYAPLAAEDRVLPQLLTVPNQVVVDEDIKLYRFTYPD